MIGTLLILGMLQATGSITGVVRSQGTLDPIARATVDVPSLRRVVTTDANGAFKLTDVPTGRWQVQARALGYAAHAVTVYSAGSGELSIDFELAVRPLRLGGLMVNRPGAVTGITADALDPAGPPPIRLSSAGELKYLPGFAEPDVLKALQVLPAVAAMSDFSSALYVRGGSSDQNALLLDGVPIYNPYHLGGLFSALNADAVGAVDIWTGALPAGQSDVLSGVVQVQPRPAARERLRAHGNIGLISSQLTVDAPLNGGRGAYLLSARKTYLDLMSRAAYKLKLLDITLPYGFSDLYGRVEHDLGKLGSITWSGYLNHEGIGVPERMAAKMSGDMEFDWGSRVSALTVRHPIGSNALAQARFGYSDFHGDFLNRDWPSYEPNYVCEPSPQCYGPGGPPPPPQPQPGDTTVYLNGNSLTRSLSAEFDLTWYLGAHQLRLGTALNAYRIGHTVEFDDEPTDLLHDLDWRERTNTLAAYLEDEWNVSERLHVRTGARLLNAGSRGTKLLPRVGARLSLTDRWAFSVGAGRYAQVLRGMRDDESIVSSLIAYELFALQPREVGLSTAEDVVVGVQWQSPRTSLRFDAYARRLNNLVLPFEMLDPEDTPPLIEDQYRVGRGTVRGLEVMARHSRDRLELGLNYAYTHVLRTIGAETFTPRFERRHTVDLTATYKMSERSLLSARLALGSGQPFTPATGVLPHWVFDGEGFDDYGNVVLLDKHNSGRLPGYARLDIAARKDMQKHWFGRDMTLTPYLQILNVLNSKNVLLSQPPAGFSGRPYFEYWPQFPVVPTFGLEWRF